MSESPSPPPTKANVPEGDEAELARMGYKQELHRELGLLQNFGVSFSIISVITGIPSLFLYGLNTGGPVVMVWGWVVVAFFTMLVGLAMAEVCSAHPTSGGPYFWAAMLSRKQNAPIASWITGWFNLLGQVAVTTGISFACANFISTACTLGGTGFVPTPKTTIGIYAAVLFSQGLTNTFGVRLLHQLNNISVWWHALGTTSLVIAILAKAPKLQSGTFVFKTFIDGTGPPGQGWGDRGGLSSQNQRHDGATTSSGSPPDISTAAGSFVTAPATIEGHTTTTESSGGCTISGSWETSTTTNVRPTGTRSGGMVERPGEDMGAGSSWRIL